MGGALSADFERPAAFSATAPMLGRFETRSEMANGTTCRNNTFLQVSTHDFIACKTRTLPSLNGENSLG